MNGLQRNEAIQGSRDHVQEVRQVFGIPELIVKTFDSISSKGYNDSLR